MKKFMVIICIWIALLIGIGKVNAISEIEYQIQYDTNTKNTYIIKNKIQEIYTKLVTGVHKESYVVMVMHNKNVFAYKQDMRVRWNHNRLEIIEGDGKGDTISGVLSADSICIPQVQPRSYLQELFSK